MLIVLVALPFVLAVDFDEGLSDDDKKAFDEILEPVMKIEINTPDDYIGNLEDNIDTGNTGIVTINGTGCIGDIPLISFVDGAVILSRNEPSSREDHESVRNVHLPRAMALSNSTTGGTFNETYWIVSPTLVANVTEYLAMNNLTHTPYSPGAKRSQSTRSDRPFACASRP